MKIHHYFEAILVFLFISCEVSTNPNDYSLDDKATASIYDWRNYGEGTYVHNRGVILYRSYEYCDIRPVAESMYKVRRYELSKFGNNITFEFYNYSDANFRLFESGRHNIFTDGFGDQYTLSVVDYDDVLDYRPSYSKEYGEWGKANIFVNGNFERDVVVTPLSAKFLTERNVNDTGALIYAKFESYSENRHLVFLFYGDINTKIIIENEGNNVCRIR